jgi:hypothetical protein
MHGGALVVLVVSPDLAVALGIPPPPPPPFLPRDCRCPDSVWFFLSLLMLLSVMALILFTERAST